MYMLVVVTIVMAFEGESANEPKGNGRASE